LLAYEGPPYQGQGRSQAWAGGRAQAHPLLQMNRVQPVLYYGLMLLPMNTFLGFSPPSHKFLATSLIKDAPWAPKSHATPLVRDVLSYSFCIMQCIQRMVDCMVKLFHHYNPTCNALLCTTYIAHGNGLKNTDIAGVFVGFLNSKLSNTNDGFCLVSVSRNT
jgi:hypothetical protein